MRHEGCFSDTNRRLATEQFPLPCIVVDSMYLSSGTPLGIASVCRTIDRARIR
jgi:hypothetical protein